ncbi:MAG TPA: tetratricopeptide repeat protein [Phycisphaerae bacterium]|nr:tetratricopeptide repeat protein [Phycisphaerae bacterium]
MKAGDEKTNVPGTVSADRLALIHRLIDDCIERRITGESLSHEALIADHPELMPELAEELKHLDVIERARRRVAGSSQLDPLDASQHPKPSLGADVFPGYDIEHEIHRGGQGVVYKAIQRSTGRTVALKVLREGMFAGTRELMRFEREIDVLGTLRHPNIVRVLDRGVTAGGSFYCVMDCIDGLPADLYVEKQSRSLSIDDVLTLFLTICDAVQAAHLNGVIHRDLKPSNILVDESGTPFVLDFGLAKRTEPSADSAMTMTGQFVGSIPWASPEQAAGASDVDVRTDVYALGLLLYRMLTRAFPYAVDGPAREVLERIIHSSPAPPSQYRREISHELETIILRCLAKDRDRRYHSAGALALDLRRMINGEPIDAKRDSTWYVLRKTLWRYRIAAGVAATFFIVVTGSAIWLAQLYSEQRTQSARAELAAADARRETERAEAINKLLESAISAADPTQERGPDYTVRELLDEFSTTLNSDTDADPRVIASVHRALGKAYRGLGLPIAAKPHTRRALAIYQKLESAPPHELAMSLNEYGLNLMNLDSNGVALDMLEQSLAILEKLQGEDHPEVLSIRSNIATALHALSRDDEAEAMITDVIARTRANSDEPQPILATYLLNLASIRSMHGHVDDAVALSEEALDIASLHDTTSNGNTARIMSALASFHREAGHLDSAIELLNRSLSIRRRLYGDEHIEVGNGHSHLATVLLNLGRLDEALEHSLKSLEICRAVYPEPHPRILQELNTVVQTYVTRAEPDLAIPYAAQLVEHSKLLHGEKHYNVVGALNTRAQLFMMQEKLSESEADFREALEIASELFGDDHPVVPILYNNLGLCLSRQDRDREAAEIYRVGLGLARRIHPDDHPGRISLTIQLAEALKFCGDYEESKQLYEEGLAMRRRVYGSDNIYTAYALNGLGDLYIEMRDFAPAEPLYRESLDITTQGLPEGHESRAIPFANLGRVLVELGRPAEAERFTRRGLEIREATRPEGDKLIARAQYWMGRCLIDLGKYDEAERHLNAALENRLADEKQLPWRRAVVMARLGEIQTARKNLAEAESLLQDAYKMAEADESVRPFILREIAQLLVDLYKDSNQPSESAKWESTRTELANE